MTTPLPDELPFTYRGFWDVPRFLLVRHGDVRIVLDCAFIDAVDEYEDVYRVYAAGFDQLPLGDEWMRDARFLGRILVGDVSFDTTRRRTVQTTALAVFFGAAGR